MYSVPQTPLPIDPLVDEIVAHVRSARSAVIVPPPGSGKTTRIAPALIALGRTILLQPRRVAARALTRRIAQERGWRVGEEIGWQIRFERRFSSRTGLLVATENRRDRKSTRLNSSHGYISYAVFCLKKKKKNYCS